MILTVTMNPSLDQTLSLVSDLVIGGVGHVGSQKIDLGGKGINVSRALHLAHVPTCALFPANAHDPFVKRIQDEEFEFCALDTPTQVRTNLTLVDAAAQTTKINFSGEKLSSLVIQNLFDELEKYIGEATWLVCAGSLPPGVPNDFYVTLVQKAREISPDIHIAVDTSGEPLVALMKSQHVIDLIKPNSDELCDLAGVLGYSSDEIHAHESDHVEIAALARKVLPTCVRAALVTLGSHGAILVEPEDVWSTSGRRVEVRSTVGAGDSSLAGYLIGKYTQQDPASCLALAAAYGSAAVALEGTLIPGPSHIDLNDIEVVNLVLPTP